MQTEQIEVHDLPEFMGQVSTGNTFHLQPNTFLVIWLVNNPTIYCLYAGQLKFLREGFCAKGYALSFTSEFMCTLKGDAGMLLHSGLFNLYQDKPVAITVENMAEIEHWIQSMIGEYYGTTELRTEMMRSLLKILIIKLSRKVRAHCLPEANIQRDIKVFKDFQELVYNHFLTMKKVSDYARALGIAPNYLNTMVKKVSGYTASHHIHQRIVAEAKRQASWEGISLKEIAYGLGFDNPSYFSKFFKKMSGTNFLAFKRASSPIFRQ